MDLKKLINTATDLASGDALTASAKGLIQKTENIPVDENTRKEIFAKICGLIPGKASNKLVLDVFELMRKQQKLMKNDFKDAIKKNQAAFKTHAEALKKANGYVEDQNKYTDMSYGKSTMQFSGCEVFATFNAMFTLNGKHEIDLPLLINEYEQDGMVLSGKFGTSPKAISDLLNKKGYKTVMISEEKDFDALGKKYKSFILTMYNNAEDIRDEVHTIHISKDLKGQFTGHNVYCNGKVVGPAKSISSLIGMFNNGKSKGICLIAVSK